MEAQHAETTLLVEVIFDNKPTQFEVIECARACQYTPALGELTYLEDKYPDCIGYIF